MQLSNSIRMESRRSVRAVCRHRVECVTARDYPSNERDLFARRTNSASGTVKVDVVVKSLLGVVSVLDGGSVSSNGQWKPSPQVGLLLTNVTSLFGTRAVAFRFRAGGAPFQIDDVYLDLGRATS